MAAASGNYIEQTSRKRTKMTLLERMHKTGFTTSFCTAICTGYRRWLLPVLLLGILQLIAAPVTGEIIAYDQITVRNKTIFLKVRTKGFLFAEGGQRVSLSVEGGPKFRILTGGDGYGYVKYTPTAAGRHTIRVDTTDAVNEAILLVVTPDESVFLLDYEMLLKRLLQNPNEKQSARQALENLPSGCHLVYGVNFLGAVMAGKWTQNQNFPRGVILTGKLSNLITNLKDREIPIRAVMGTAASLAGFTAEGVHQLSFDETPSGTTIDNWEQIQKIITEDKNR